MSKITALIKSRRFWVAVSSVAFVAVNQLGLGLDQATVQMIVLSAAAWIIGDSINKTE